MSISFLFLQLSHFCQMLPEVQKTANQMTNFYLKYNIELEWLKTGYLSQIFDQEFENRKNLRLDFHLSCWFDPSIKLQIWYECSQGVSLKNQNFLRLRLSSTFNDFDNSSYGANFSPTCFPSRTKTILYYSSYCEVYVTYGYSVNAMFYVPTVLLIDHWCLLLPTSDFLTIKL